MKVKKLIASGLMAVIAVGILAGCGAKDNAGKPSSSTAVAANSKDITLKVWDDNDNLETTKKLIEAFKKEHPDKNYNIEVAVSSTSKAQEELKKDPEAAADVFPLPHDQVGQLAEAGILYENSKYIDRIKQEDTETSLDAATYKGVVYGYPYAVEAMYLAYNKSMLSDQDVKTFEGITAKAPIGLNLIEEGTNYTIAPQYVANGCLLYGEKGEDLNGSTFNAKEGVNVTKWIASLKNNTNVIACNSEGIASLKDGKIAAMVTGPWGKNDIMDALGDNLGVAVYPTCDFGNGPAQMRSFQGVKLLAVNATTKYPLDAMELADYLTNEESQKARFEATGAIPCNKKLRDSDEIKNDPITNVVAQMTQEDHTVLMPKLPQLRSFWNLLDPIIIDSYNGKLTEGDMQTKLNELVKEAALDGAAE